jgi:signal transduction histidine kinase/CheY-like chemotaxis protein
MPLWTALGAGAVGVASALVLRGVAGRWTGRLARAVYSGTFLTIDIAMVSLVVAVTGGRASPWFPWYIAIISAAAFIAGQGTAFGVFVASTAGYVVALVVAGDVEGLGPPLWNGVGVMVCLYVASYFFLRGVVMLRDRGERIQAMEADGRRKLSELTRLTAALEERTREIEEANVRLTEADRLKTQFLANVSHELRTPLNSIIGFSEILQGQLRDRLDARQERFLEHIHSAGESLLSIINDILDLSRIEAGTLELAPEKVPLRSSIDGVCTILKGLAAKKDVRLVVSTPEDLPIVEADPVRFKQMVYHLASNAVKFSRPGEEVRIEAHRSAAADNPLAVDCIELVVADRGVGISPEHLETIFEAFRQVDGTASREFQGAGLGLAIVKRVVELHGGRVAVESALGKGSVFRVLWPIEFRGEGEVVPDRPSVHVEGPAREVVLVVEDDPTAFETLREALEASEFRVVRARNGEEALRLARAEAPSAITLDVVLPGIDGFKILRRLREDEATREIPVVIVSMLENRDLGIALGADDYLVKPVDAEDLIRRLRGLVTTRDDEPLRVLVIDDDPALHEMLESKLSPSFELVRALSGREGLSRARHGDVDVVVLDLMMEGMDGFEVATLLKEGEETRELPIVILTAKDLVSEERDHLHDKVEALVRKGGSPVGQLERVIRQALRRSRGRRASP